MSTETSKRLVKNTAFMYLRMGVLLVISLYTSRVVLRELGVNDYGIYNLVGSVVGIFSSLKILFSSSTQRFLNYEMGRGKADKLPLVFNISIAVNLAICIIFVILVEAVGLWFLEYKINVAPDRYFATVVVFHLSVLTAVIGIMTSPYDAVIIAHERMDFFAFCSILEGVLRLIIVFLLVLAPSEKLITYAILQLFVTITIRVISTYYCKKNFSECSYKRLWNKNYFKQMFSFAGWNFLGITSYTLYHNGLNMILNIFGGPIVNAARGIAYQINNVLYQFINNVTIVINPFCIREWSAGAKEKAFKLIFISSKILFFIQLCLLMPIFYLTFDILNIWLGEVPKYSVAFIRLILIYSLVRALHPSMDLIFKSTGRIKYYQITEGLLQILPLTLAYIFLKFGYSYSSAFIIAIVCELLNLMVVMCLARVVGSLNIKNYLLKVLLPCALMFTIMIIPYYAFHNDVQTTWLKLTIVAALYIIEGAMWFFCCLDKWERDELLLIIKKRKNE